MKIPFHISPACVQDSAACYKHAVRVPGQVIAVQPESLSQQTLGPGAIDRPTERALRSHDSHARHLAGTFGNP
jgi:hypothetical protein